MIVYISALTSYCHWYGLPIHPRVVVVVVDEVELVVEDGEEAVEVDGVGHHQEDVVDEEEVVVDDLPVEGFPVGDVEVLVEVEEVVDDPLVGEEVEGVHKNNSASLRESKRNY